MVVFRFCSVCGLWCCSPVWFGSWLKSLNLEILPYLVMVQVILHCRTWFQAWFKQFWNFELDLWSGLNFGSGLNRGITICGSNNLMLAMTAFQKSGTLSGGECPEKKHSVYGKRYRTYETRGKSRWGYIWDIMKGKDEDCGMRLRKVWDDNSVMYMVIKSRCSKLCFWIKSTSCKQCQTAPKPWIHTTWPCTHSGWTGRACYWRDNSLAATAVGGNSSYIGLGMAQIMTNGFPWQTSTTVKLLTYGIIRLVVMGPTTSSFSLRFWNNFFLMGF